MEPFAYNNPFYVSGLPSMAGRADFDRWADDLGTETPLGARAAGFGMAEDRGWTGEDWAALEAMWNSESFNPSWRTGWDWRAGPDRPGRTALGIPQMVGYWHAPNRGMWPQDHPYRGDPREQIRLGMDYIQSTYGSPSRAWEHWKSEKVYPNAAVETPYFHPEWNRWVGGTY
jgi:hypothetical protein